MKSLQLVITLALLVALVSMTAFPAGVEGRKAISSQGRAGFDRTAFESDVPADQPMRFGAAVKYDRSLSVPKVEAINAAGLSKYPGVSATGLSGTYTIPGDFSDLASAVAVLNYVGLAGDAIFELASTSYLSSPVTIGSYAGAGTYNLTIRPAAGTAVTLNFLASNTNGKGISFNGASNVTVDGDNAGSSLTMGIDNSLSFPSGDPFASTVYITNGSSDITVANAHIIGNYNGGSWATQTEGRSCAFVYAGPSDAASNSDITFDGCTFTGGSIGVKALMDWNAGVFTAENLTVENSNFGGGFGDPLIHAMWAELVYNIQFNNNTIIDVSFLVEYWDNYASEFAENNVFLLGGEGNQNIWYWLGQTTAFHILLGHSGKVDGNYIDGVTSDAYAGSGAGVGYGTRTLGGNLGYGGTTDIQVSNNRFKNVFYDNSHTNIAVIRGGGINVWHNSVHMTGTNTLAGSYSCLNGVTTAYNNALVNDIVTGTATRVRGVNPGGTIDYNAIYSAGIPTSSHTTVVAALAAGINNNGIWGKTQFTWDLHGDSTFPTAAQDIGRPFTLPLTDIDAESRDTTFAGMRDAGADEFAGGALLGTDVLPVAITAPPAGGVPTGVPVVPVVAVKNNSPNAATFNMSLTISPDGYSQTVSVSLNPGQQKSVSYPSWTPASATPQTITATTLLGGDINTGNDVLARAQTVQAPVAITTPTTYTFDASAEGWTGAIDWIRSSTFTKLSGRYTGAGSSWVTVQGGASTVGNKATYTEGAFATSQGYATTYPGANLLTSPWLDLSGLSGTDLYISFVHSIETEPLWDRSWMQYTTDGITWSDLGVLNDPNGINWYDEGLYEHAALDDDNIDHATLLLYNLGAGPPASWTSNDAGTTGAPGDFLPNGPYGWVYAQLKLTTTSHPTVARAPVIRFRYVAFSDAVASEEGWAFDNFTLTNVAPVFPGGSIAGHAWNDVNGNGVDDGEADITGTKVYISYYGVLQDSVTTDGLGDYSYGPVNLPGVYNVQLNVTGTAFTVPFGVSNTANVNHDALGGTVTQDFGTFAGSISGKKFNDVNDNGADDSEPGLAGWTINVHRDSANGPFMGSAVTAVGGTYSINVPAYAGTYYIKETLQPAVARQTAPVGGVHTATINGGTPTATGKDFGNFLYGRLRVQLTVDQNGNGVRDAGDIIAVPSGSSSNFSVKKNGVHLVGSPFTLGNGAINATFTGLDTGTYVVDEIDSIPGWLRTNTAKKNLVITSSGVIDTADALDFKLITISGTKYNDLNGNGAKDLGEPGLAGWTINVSGGSYLGGTSAVTDGSGNYSIDSVFNGTHTVAEVVQSGWTRTAPGGAGTHSINGISGNFITTTGKDFGNFQNATVSGIVYRDYNGNGTMDPEDTPMSGVNVALAVNGGSDVSDGSGYSMTGVITTDTVRITTPGGFAITQPVAGEYPIALTSGGSFNGNFGLFQVADSSTKYRTFTAEQLRNDLEKKPGKRPKPGKAYDPIKNKPSTANLIDDLINPKTGQGFEMKVGLSDQTTSGGKVKAFWKPIKQGDVFKSLNNKSVFHIGMPRGFDQDLKGKPFIKQQKNFPPNKKQNNKLFAELVALNVNLTASGAKTPAGLGSLIYNDPASSLNGMTIDEIEAYADTVMTNFEFVPLGVYIELDSVVAKINAAFMNPATDDTSAGWAAPKLMWAAYKSVFEVPYLKPNPGTSPVNRRTAEPEAVPTAFALEQNYPNPFNPTTTIEFDIPEVSIVTLKVYNLLGQEVATLLDRETVEFGDAVEFDASSLPSGVYLYRIVAETIADADAGIEKETFTQVKKMVLVK